MCGRSPELTMAASLAGVTELAEYAQAEIEEMSHDDRTKGWNTSTSVSCLFQPSHYNVVESYGIVVWRCGC